MQREKEKAHPTYGGLTNRKTTILCSPSSPFIISPKQLCSSSSSKISSKGNNFQWKEPIQPASTILNDQKYIWWLTDLFLMETTECLLIIWFIACGFYYIWGPVVHEIFILYLHMWLLTLVVIIIWIENQIKCVCYMTLKVSDNVHICFNASLLPYRSHFSLFYLQLLCRTHPLFYCSNGP